MLITKISKVQGSSVTRAKKFSELGLILGDGYVDGNWDIDCDLFKESRFYKDLNLYLKHGHEKAKNMYSGYYDWHSLFQSILTKGYVQNENERAVEIAIGRNEELFFVDGRHRLAIAQHLKIKEIPVDLVYQHKKIKK